MLTQSTHLRSFIQACKELSEINRAMVDSGETLSRDSSSLRDAMSKMNRTWVGNSKVIGQLLQSNKETFEESLKSQTVIINQGNQLDHYAKALSITSSNIEELIPELRKNENILQLNLDNVRFLAETIEHSLYFLGEVANSNIKSTTKVEEKVEVLSTSISVLASQVQSLGRTINETRVSGPERFLGI